MTAPFNPLAGNFSSVQWMAPAGDYNLKVMKFTFGTVGDDNTEVLNIDLAIEGGEFNGKRPPRITIWEPRSDFSKAARVIVSAMGYRPGKDDARFMAENSDMDLSIDPSANKGSELGAGYERVVGFVFTSTVVQTPSKKDGTMYQNYNNIRPMDA